MPDIRAPLLLNSIPVSGLVPERRSSAPSSPSAGRIYFDTTLGQLGVYNGATWIYVGSTGILSLAATAPINTTGGANPSISITPASGSLAGSMSIADFNKLSAATAQNTPSTIIQRNSSGDFAAGTITASLTGTAQNASQLNNLAPSTYLDRNNHTGTQSSGTITGFDVQVQTSKLNQMAAPTASVSMNSQRITGLGEPTSNSDAATRGFVEAIVSTGVNKGCARVIATSNINISAPGAVIDTITLSSSNADIVLLIAQTIASQNGLYVFNGSSVPLTRALNADISAEVKTGLFVFVSEGSASNVSTSYTLVTPAPIVLDTTALTFTQTSGAGQITAGAGLVKSGNVLSVGAGTGITVNTDDIAINTSVVVRKTTPILIGNGTTTVFSLTHNLNNIGASVLIQLVSSGAQVEADIINTAVNTASIEFAVAPTTDQFRVIFSG